MVQGVWIVDHETFPADSSSFSADQQQNPPYIGYVSCTDLSWMHLLNGTCGLKMERDTCGERRLWHVDSIFLILKTRRKI